MNENNRETLKKIYVEKEHFSCITIEKLDL